MKLIEMSCCCVLSLLIGGLFSREASSDVIPPVTAPTDAFFHLVDEEDREAARLFYGKQIDVLGMPVVASGQVADLALHRTYEIVTHMLAGRPDLLQAMVRNRMYLIVIGKDQLYTDMPEYRNRPNPDYLNERVRGTGGRPTSFGEENLLSLPRDRYDDESIAIHEFCHTIDGTLRSIDPTWKTRLRRTFDNAKAKGLFHNTYAQSNAGEYWAEMAQSYFDSNRVNNWNHGPIGTREQLKVYDPEGYELVRSVFRLPPEQDWRYAYLQPLPTVATPPEDLGYDPYYTKFTWAREFPVVGRSASDAALLRANDTIRKMFAYRHDILKAMITEDLRLVVLGEQESLSDLPEAKPWRNLGEVDLLSRTLGYSPATPLIVVGEENVLADPRTANGSGSHLIREFAKALYHLTAHRPVDPDWENRGREVQQYELRVQRLDVRFDEQLQKTFALAMEQGKWKGTAARHDRVAYWAEGVLAYFDAQGQDAAPLDAKHPIRTREQLREYDSELFQLVEQTMGYGGQVDWRYKP